MSVETIGWWPRFTLCALALWRLTHLLAKEDGPADVIFRLRTWLGDSWLGRAMDCFYCLSMWIALPCALLVGGNWLDRALAWPALSGAACLLERAFFEREVTNVLRTEKGIDGESYAGAGAAEEVGSGGGNASPARDSGG
jgi:hypothetical protein